MSAQSSNSAEPNLTPLLDVVFQLITFFMLVINFTADNYDLRIKLPVAGSARPLDAADQEERLVLNIDSMGRLLFNGKTLAGSEIYKTISFEAQLAKLNRKAVNGKKAAPTDPLTTRVVIRADKDTPFESVNSVIKACQNNQFQKFDLKAMNGE